MFTNKILFINPPLTSREAYGNFEQLGNRLPPLGICSLAAITRKYGFDTGIIDAQALGLNHEETVTKISYEKPRYIGITASTQSIFSAAEIAALLKKREPGLITIIGGPHLSALPIETMERFPQFDIGIAGEGELTIIDFLNAHQNGRNIEDVSGVIYRKAGQLYRTQKRPFIRELDTLPLPAWDLLPNLSRHYRPAINNFARLPSIHLITSRGCPFKCIFCDRSTFGNRWRAHSPEYVLKMVKTLYYRYRIRDIFIADDCFTNSKSMVINLCNLLIKSKLGVSWSCQARIDQVNPELLELMRKAGCWGISYGLESGSQKILNLIQKGIDLEQAQKAVTWTRKAGVFATGLFMIGHPLETDETIRQTIEFAKRLNLDMFQLAFFTPYPGTEIYESANNYGSFDNDLERLNSWEPNFIPKGLTKNMLLRFFKLAYRKFYIRPSFIFRYLWNLRRSGMFLKFYHGGRTLLRLCMERGQIYNG